MPKIQVNPFCGAITVNIGDGVMLEKGATVEVSAKRFEELSKRERLGLPVIVKYDPPKSAGADDAEGDS